MFTPILNTKLFIPPVRTDLLSRPRLVKKLNESVACRLCLLSASAGFGKTTLLSEWAAQNRRPTAWISLDTADNEPAQFLIYLVSALRTLNEDFGGQMLERLQSFQSESFEAVFINLTLIPMDRGTSLTGNIAC